MNRPNGRLLEGAQTSQLNDDSSFLVYRKRRSPTKARGGEERNSERYFTSCKVRIWSSSDAQYCFSMLNSVCAEAGGGAKIVLSGFDPRRFSSASEVSAGFGWISARTRETSSCGWNGLRINSSA